MAKESKKEKKWIFNYKLIIATLVLLVVAFYLGIMVLDVFKDGTYIGERVNKTDKDKLDIRPIPDADDLEKLSQDLLTLEASESAWSEKEKAPEASGLFFISGTNSKYLIYNIHADNLEEKGYSFKDYSHIWVNSEDDDFYAVINIGGEKIDLTDYYILIRDETRNYASRVIFNCYEAKEVILKDTILTGTLIAPYGHVIYDNTFLYGQVHGKSYEGEQKFYREVLFTGYTKLMYDLTYAIFEDDVVRIAAIEYLMEKDLLGRYSDYNRDSKLRLADTHAIKSLKLDGKTLSSDTLGRDLSLFENLEELSSRDNNLREIELAYAPNLKRLYLDNNEIEDLDLLRSAKLEELSLNGSKIKTLDLSNTTSLYYLSLENSLIESLDFSKLTGLLNLNINKSSLGSVDLSKNTKLVNLSFAYTNLSLDDLDSHLNLEYIDAKGTNLSHIGLKREKLNYLNVGDNKGLTQLDMSLFPNLQYLNVSNCSLTSLNLENSKITSLNVSFNKIEEINLAKAPFLTRVEIYGDSIKEIITRKNIRIYYSGWIKITEGE